MAARRRRLAITAAIVGSALAVALLTAWIWAPAPTGGDAPGAGWQADVTGPVGRIGGLTAGRTTGAATDPPERLADGSYAGQAGTGVLSGPIGGLEAGRVTPTVPRRRSALAG